MPFGKLQCKPCGKIFSGDACYQEHVAGEKHKKKVARYVSSGLSAGNKSCLENTSSMLSPGHEERPRSSDSETKCSKMQENYCKLCNLKFHSLCSYANHLHTSEHKVLSEVSGELKKMKLSTMDDKYSAAKAVECLEFYCELCDCKYSSEDQFKQHIKNSEHQKKQSATTRDNKLGLLSSAHAASNIDYKLPDSPFGIHAKAEANVLKSSNYICPLCTVSCTGFEPYEQHLKSKKHLKKLQNRPNEDVSLKNDCCMGDSSYAVKLESSVMTHQATSAETSLFRCDPCGKVFTAYVSYTDHLESDNHRKKLRVSRLISLGKSNMSEMDAKTADGSHVLTLDQRQSKYCNLKDLNLIIFLPEEEVTFDNLEDYTYDTNMDH